MSTCKHALSLGWFVDGQFIGSDWLDRSDFAQGVLDFMARHFKHDVVLLDVDQYLLYLTPLPEAEWPLSYFLDEDNGEIISREYGRKGPL